MHVENKTWCIKTLKPRAFVIALHGRNFKLLRFVCARYIRSYMICVNFKYSSVDNRKPSPSNFKEIISNSAYWLIPVHCKLGTNDQVLFIDRSSAVYFILHWFDTIFLFPMFSVSAHSLELTTVLHQLKNVQICYKIYVQSRCNMA